MQRDFSQQVEHIINKDNRYRYDAYEFVVQALHYTQKKFKRRGHLTGKELLEGFKDLAREQFGPMALTVLGHWGIRTTEDVGEIVFNLVDNKLLFKTEGDTKEDFKAVYDFGKVFDEEYQEIVNKQIKGGGF